MTIVKYHPEKIYNSKDFRNEVRRATQITIERGFKQLPLSSKAVDLLMSFPMMGYLLRQIANSANKLLANINTNKLLNKKED